MTQTAVNRETQINAATLNATHSALAGAATGAVSGAAMGAAGGPWGAAIGGIAGAITGGLTSGTAGAVSVYNTVAAINAEKYSRSLQPPQASGNTNSGDVTCSNNDLTFTAYKMSVKAEFARIIDDYFSMFGYQTNRVKIPNTNHRQNYWYTKTVGIDIDGKIPQKDMHIIKNAYNNGITFWRDADLIGSYVSNPIQS